MIPIFARRGRRAERRAARYLRRRGFRILAFNLRAAGGEIDILAAESGVLVVVEVRKRQASILRADLSVDRSKEARLIRCTQALRSRKLIPGGMPLRFDLVLIGGLGRIAHLRGALHRDSRL